MKKSAFEDFGEGAMEAAYEAYEFTQCQRSDGTIYGTKGKCAQKGAKEVSPKKGGEGGGQLALSSTRKQAGAMNKAYTDDLDKLGTHALRDRMTGYIGKTQGKSATDSGAPINTDNKKPTQFVITESFDRINKIRRGEGKEPMTLTSIIDAVDLQRVGIDPNKANTLAKQGKSRKEK
jgi:hypothetical protein